MSSYDDRPWDLIREFNLHKAKFNCDVVIGLSVGSRRKISFSSSWIALSAIGFLFGFLIRPNSKMIPFSLSGWLLNNVWKPGAGSVRTVVVGPSLGWRGNSSDMVPSSKSLSFSECMNVALV